MWSRSQANQLRPKVDVPIVGVGGAMIKSDADGHELVSMKGLAPMPLNLALTQDVSQSRQHWDYTENKGHHC